jgi:hypothetical protein
MKNLKMISPSLHGIIDYIVDITLICLGTNQINGMITPSSSLNKNPANKFLITL